MKRKLFALSMAAIVCIQAMSQTIPENMGSQYIEEDPSTIVTVQSIVDMQQDLANREFYSQHIDAVWQRRGFFNIVYHRPATLNIKKAVPAESGITGETFTSQFGFALQAGKNHQLHKKPIGKVLGINLDFLPLDLYVNKYGESKMAEDYRPTYTTGNSTYLIRPWHRSKWEINYSMSLGPSITLAPFVPLKNMGAAFIKLNIFFHVGYCASAMLFQSDSKESGRKLMADFGHGMYTSYGLNLSWKAIGFGFEHRSGTSKYMSIYTICGTDKYDMKSTQNRFYLNFRF